MTVADLIAELQRMPPNTRVHCVTRTAYYADEMGETTINLCEADSTEVDEVRHEGPYVLIQGK